MSPEKIIWVGGYPRVVNVPEEPKPETLPEQLTADEQWEAEAKAHGLTGWALTQAFVRRVLGGE